MRKVCGLVIIMCLGAAACGEDSGGDDPGGSTSVEVIASVLGLQDATGDVTEARLAIIEDGAFAEEAVDPILTIGDTEIALTAQRVGLKDGTATTWYEANSRSQAGLVYTPGQTARFDFALTSTRARYSTEVVLAAQATQLDPASEPGIGKDIDIVASGQFDGALLLVERLDTSEQTYSSYPFRSELVAGAGEIPRAGALRGIEAGVVTVPGEAFSRRGTHEVIFVGLELSEGGDGVGDQSVTFAGTARATMLDIN
jgi:hypothetical protein